MEKPILKALKGERTKTTPVWFMRQAGRCLPEYRAIKEKMKTYDMFRTPDVATEITLQPLKRFPVDAAIVYADILHIPDALGCGLSFQPGDGPKFSHVVRVKEDLAILKDRIQNKAKLASELSFVGETLSRVKPQLDKHQTLIGFAGAPWTVASYVVEGGSSDHFFKVKSLMMKDPAVFKELMEILTEATIPYLEMQVSAGAEVVQLFESWGGQALGPSMYNEFCRPYVERIISHLSKKVPVIHFVNRSAGIWDEVVTLPSQGVGIDWAQPLSRVAQDSRMAGRCIQGNLDPMWLYANWETLEREALKVLKAGRSFSGGYIFNVGHGFTPDTPIESISKLVELVHKDHG
jgi:uroporphyrinogen decarboxylase